MEAGLDLWDAAGNLIFSPASGAAKVYRKLLINSESGSVTIDRPPNGGSLFAAFTGQIPAYSMDGTITVSGNTVSWSGIWPSRLPKHMVIGECSR